MFYQEWLQERASKLIPALRTLTPVLTTLHKHRSIRAMLMERSALRGEEGVDLASEAGTPSTTTSG